jgi:hypothetical protein
MVTLKRDQEVLLVHDNVVVPELCMDLSCETVFLNVIIEMIKYHINVE